MKQEIICQKGKCAEVEIKESKFEGLFGSTSIVEQMQIDQIKGMKRR